jgi:hypothetical protein
MNLLKAIYIFFGSPGDTEPERKRFKEIIYNYNISNAIQREHIFVPIIYEDIPGKSGERPQSVINDKLVKCDYFIGMFWKTLGSKSTNRNYESNTVEEYRKAQKRLKKGAILLLFKKIPSEKLNDPKVKRVVVFKKKIEKENNTLYKPCGNKSVFSDKIRSQLDAWLFESESKKISEPVALSAKDEFQPSKQIISDITTI